jgi:phosphatidylserine/phosphatidylglycerophosphate/cardiolipin synthase-like enzyme
MTRLTSLPKGAAAAARVPQRTRAATAAQRQRALSTLTRSVDGIGQHAQGPRAADVSLKNAFQAAGLPTSHPAYGVMQGVCRAAFVCSAQTLPPTLADAAWQHASAQTFALLQGEPGIFHAAARLQRQLAHRLVAPAAGPCAAAMAGLDAMAAAAAQSTATSSVPPAAIDSAATVFPTVLHTGDEIWGAAGSLIAMAQRSVELQTWAFQKNSEAAKHVFGGVKVLQERLCAARAAGTLQAPVRLDLLIDDNRTGVVGGRSVQYTTERHRGQKTFVATQQPNTFYGLFPFRIDPELIEVRVFTHNHWRRGAIHEKLLVIDEQLGVLATANVHGEHHRLSNNGSNMHDAALVLAGPAMQTLSQVMRHYLTTKRSRLVASNAAEQRLDLQDIVTPPVDFTAYTPYHLGDDETRVRDKVAAALSHVVVPPGETPAAARVLILAKVPVHGLTSSRTDSPLYRATLAALQHAKTSIKINHVNLNAPEVVKELKRALSRGVDVQVLLPYHACDLYYRPLGRANHQTFDSLQRHVQRHQPRGKLRTQWHTRDDGTLHAGSNHTKVMVIDDEIVVFGSANLDTQSMKYCGELEIATADPGTVRALLNTLWDPFWDRAMTYVAKNETAARSPAQEVPPRFDSSIEVVSSRASQSSTKTNGMVSFTRKAPERASGSMFFSLEKIRKKIFGSFRSLRLLIGSLRKSFTNRAKTESNAS